MTPPRATLSRRSLVTGGAAIALGAGAGPALARSVAPLPLARVAPELGLLPRAGLWGPAALLDPAPSLAAALGLHGGLWLARDDRGGTLFGGGKARKLDLLLGQAKAEGAVGVATTGGASSNHARSTAWAAAHLGLTCDLALLPEPSSPEVRRNLAAMEAAGARIAIGGPDAVRRLERRAAASSGALAWIPMGGTSPRADLAFASAAFEVEARVAAGELPPPETLVLALGSGGSAVGLAIGLVLAGLPTSVVAVRCSSPATSSEATLGRLLEATCDHLARLWPGAPRPASLAREARGRIRIDGSELGAGYARSTAASIRAARSGLELLGVILDRTYSAKAAASLARQASTLRGPVLLWLGCDARWLEAGA